MAGIIGDMARMAGENLRISKGKRQTANMSAAEKQNIADATAAAKNGDISAMTFLAFRYYEGTPVGYDPDQAGYWWTEAANRGDVNSQYNLGLLYSGQLSCFWYDVNHAGYWFYAAAQNGNRDAAQELQKYKYSKLRGKWVLR